MTIDRRHAALVSSPLLLIGVALAAFNLRPAVTSIASVLGEVQGDVGASLVWASVLTAVPAICFGLAAIAAPWLNRRLGLAQAIGLALAVLTFGLILRVLGGPWTVLGGTFIATSGIAIGNVLIPVVVKQSFPHAVGRVTGMYTSALAAGGGIAAAATPALEHVLGGWRGAVGAWAALSAGALALWLIGVRHEDDADVPTVTEARRRSLLRSPVAWVVTGFFAMQSCSAYILMGWLVEFFVSHGVARTEAGIMLALMNLMGIPLNLVIPLLALRRNSQSGWILAVTASSMIAVIGLAAAPTAAPWVWTVLLGVGTATLPIALGLIALRTAVPSETAALSAMSQGFGYLIAAAGPLAFGILHAMSTSWALPLLLLGVVTVVQGMLGWLAGRPRLV
ncbi:MFS transporter [Mycobacterium sp. 236(2023)]|uniref:MFS transporter n=1 Tax=Mycobacterium sp. 236(2023) TaxID=3038163 RepID=UPI002414F39E|nr:MFS transporter [Mycobacterium sp. 236(2023)]MDG4669194.1 MFS transporter [Mycobacterium sp. 236(2023)]